MSEAIKKLLGDEKYNQFLEDTGLKENEFDLLKNYIPRSRFNEVNDIKKQLDAKIEDYNKQLKATKKMLSENDDFKNKYSELETKFNDTMALKDKQITNISKMAIVEAELSKAGAKHSNLLKGQIDLEKLQLEGDKLIGITDTIKNLKNDYADMFIEKKQNNNIKPNNNDADDPGAGNDTIDGVDWGKKFDQFL